MTDDDDWRGRFAKDASCRVCVVRQDWCVAVGGVAGNFEDWQVVRCRYLGEGNKSFPRLVDVRPRVSETYHDRRCLDDHQHSGDTSLENVN